MVDEQRADGVSSVGHLVAAAGASGGELLIVATGQYCGVSGHTRVTIVDGTGRERADGIVAIGAVAEVMARLAQAGATVRSGEVDTMHATPWTWCWTTDWRRGARPMLVLDCAPVDGPPPLVVGEEVVARGRHIARSACAQVEARLSADWTVREVILRLADDEAVAIAREVNPWPTIDPTYGGLDLMCDASWATSLASEVSVALGVRLVVDPDLR